MGQVVVGIDFGTLSGRAVVVNVGDGKEIASAVHTYAHGVIDASLPSGRPLGPGWALQAPEDWRAVVKHAVPEALQASGVALSDVVGIATDFTACTVLPVTTEGVPLCEAWLTVRIRGRNSGSITRPRPRLTASMP